MSYKRGLAMKSSVLDTPKRLQKPRNFGLTSMYDIGMPLVLTKGYLEDFSDYFDIAKLAAFRRLQPPAPSLIPIVFDSSTRFVVICATCIVHCYS